VDQALRLDTTVMLVDDPVKRVDNMTMAWGLEAQVPFLDHELVELAARVPAELKVAEGGKYVLKEAARKVIPAAVIDRPKGYFPVPALKYLRGPFLELVRDLVTSEMARSRGLFQQGHAGAHVGDRGRQGVEEARALVAHVEGGHELGVVALAQAELLLHVDAAAGERVLGREGGDDDEVEVGSSGHL
jgi:asparagine synthetase B (glutamine-hydrolysing)